jgi:hypothetical protein
LKFGHSPGDLGKYESERRDMVKANIQSGEREERENSGKIKLIAEIVAVSSTKEKKERKIERESEKERRRTRNSVRRKQYKSKRRVKRAFVVHTTQNYNRRRVKSRGERRRVVHLHSTLYIIELVTGGPMPLVWLVHVKTSLSSTAALFFM